MPEAASTLVPVEHVRTFLPKALPWLEKTISGWGTRHWTVEGLVDSLLSGRHQLWVAQADDKFLFVVTEVVPDLSGLYVQIILGGGELDDAREILGQIARIEKWAKDIGAVGLVVWGRLGWKKLLAPYGYQFETAVFRRVFTERMN